MADLIKKVMVKARQQFCQWQVWLKFFLASLFVTAAITVVIFFIASIYVVVYRDRVYPGVYLGNYSVGGLNREQLKNFIENINNRYSKEGIDLLVIDSGGQERKIKFNMISGEDASVELVRLDSDKAGALALAIGRGGAFWRRFSTPLFLLLFSPIKLTAPVISNDAVFKEAIKDTLSSYEDAPHNASIVFASGQVADYKIVPEKIGKVFNYGLATEKIKRSLSVFSFDPILIEPSLFMPLVTQKNVEAIAGNLPALFAYGPLKIAYVDPQTKLRHDWTVTESDLAGWLEVRQDDGQSFVFALRQDAVLQYFADQIKPRVEVEPQNAKFVIKDNKAEEFQASRSGFRLNMQRTYANLDAAFIERNYHPADPVKAIGVEIDRIEPQIKTADVNNMGITAILGVGVSTFKDSHTNRIKNIANAVKRLNGILIKPGEVFSANHFVGPYTAENGFLPEQIIKGREIKKEVGGGMCQIGTTLFRMAMNSGMVITQRRNHSLVVGYYADPINGNPGTDATLYEPDVDFKFINDTGNYLLLQTDIDFKRQQLTFTLWGKPDGRNGWYTRPIVSKWIPSAEDEQTIVVIDGSLKPGEKKCQSAFKGAIASFVYSRIATSGEKIDRTFDSYYRPLPKICMIGATSTVVSAEQ